MSKQERIIDIKNVGPITHVSIPLPEGGGVVVFRGRNGLGKSTALEAIEALAGQKRRLSVRDGEVSGSIEGLGARVTVGKSSRRTGELEVQSLDGKLSVAELVEPGIADPIAADAKRIKALVQLAGVSSSVELFRDKLCHSDAEKEILGKALSKRVAEATDLVAMADAVKRDIEAAARDAEQEVSVLRGRVDGLRKSVAGVAVDGPSPEDAQRELEQAVATQAEVKAILGENVRREAARSKAAEQLRSVDAKKQRADVEQAKASVTMARTTLDGLLAEKQKLAEQVSVNAKATASMEHSLSRATSELQFATQAVEQTAAYEQAIATASECVAPPTSAEDAAAKVEAARELLASSVLRKKAAAVEVEAVQIEKGLGELTKRAATLRTFASKTDSVLTDAVSRAGSPLYVYGGRLMAKSDRKIPVAYADLSHGERWKLAIDVAVESLGKDGLIVIPQTAWEGLDPDNRLAVTEHCKSVGVVAVTAESDSGGLSMGGTK